MQVRVVSDEGGIVKMNFRTPHNLSDSAKDQVMYILVSHLLTSTLVSLMLEKVVDSLTPHLSPSNNDLPNAILLCMKELYYDQFRKTIESIKCCRSTG